MLANVLCRSRSAAGLLFVAVLGACSALAPSDDDAARAESQALTVIADVAATNMATKVGGQQVGTVWAFYGNGQLAHTFSFPTSRTYELTVRAFGSPAGAVWPNLQVRIDGATVGNIAVSATNLTAFTVKALVTAGAHVVTLAFTNDALIGGEDRNVWIAGLTISQSDASCTDPPPAPTTPPPAPTTPPPTPPPTGAFDLRAFLSKYTTFYKNEGRPSGVPTSWDWYEGGTGKSYVTAPPGTGWVNWWAVAAVDTTLIRAANTKIEFRNPKLLVLPNGSNTWVTYFAGAPIGGGGFKSDFTGGCAYGGVSMGANAISMKPLVNCLDHIWPTNPAFVEVGGSIRAAIAIASVRLIKDDPNGPDDRASSHYLVQMGSDWRSPDGNCQKNASGQLVCSGVGGGAFIYAKNHWRAAVMSTLSVAEIGSLPLPPASAFALPDGSMPAE